MARVKRGVTSHAKHKKILKAAKGYYGRRKNTIRIAKQAVEKANQYAFRDRKRRKRTFRALWIQRLNAAVRPFGITYSRFIDGLAKAGITVDRKVLSDLAIREPAAFQAIVEKAKAALPQEAAAAAYPRGVSPAERSESRDDRGGQAHDRSRLCAAHGALQSLAEPESVRGRGSIERWGAPARARRVLRLDPQDAEPSALGRSDLDEPVLRRGAEAAGRHPGVGLALSGLGRPEARARRVRRDDHRLGRHARPLMACR